MSYQDQPLPTAFVSRDFDHEVIGNFLKKKYLALSQYIGKPETLALHFSADDFKDLFSRISAHPEATGLKVYFATYCLTGIPEVDDIVRAGNKDLLTLIFGCVDQDRKELECFCLVNPNGGVLELSRATADMMITEFRQNKLPLLQEIIYDAGRPEFTETNTIYYDLDKFTGPYGLIREMDNQQVTGITVFIGSYAKGYTMSGTGGATHDIGWQLTLIFEFAKTVHYNGNEYLYNFDLEDTSDFSTRQLPPVSRSQSLGFSFNPGNFIFGGDTGNPCPPPSVCS